MKNDGNQDQQGGTAPPAPPGSVTAPVPPPGSDGGTRGEVARVLLEQGPMTAAAVAEQLGISPAAVRRHLDALLADREAETREASRRGRRGRGRPAKLFLLTEQGRARFGHAYDDLAVSAIRFLAEHAGEEAVRAFAERRVAALVDPYWEQISQEAAPADKAEALATVLTREGYAASTRQVDAGGPDTGGSTASGSDLPGGTGASGTTSGTTSGTGAQLCQHHCPVAHVAAEFPQLCEAETEAFAQLLGTHVQRLATIARGDAACTTHVPGPAPGHEARTPNGGTTA